MIRSVLILALLAGSALAQPAPPGGGVGLGLEPDAETIARARALYAEGSRQYDLREYAKAIETFRKAYDIYPQPLFLFNIGQAYRQLGDCDNARGFYRNYLAKVPAADNRETVERFLGELDRCVRTREEASAARASAPPPSGDRTLRLAGYIAVGAGGLLTALGVKYSLDAASRAQEAEDACAGGCDSAQIEDIDRSGRAAERNAIVLYTVGGAAIATGAGLLIYGALHPGRERIIVAPVPGGAQVSATWSFR